MNDIFRDENVKMLYLLSSFGIGKPRIWELERYFGSLDELYKAIAFERDNKLFTPEEKKSASATTAKQLYELLNYCNENGIGIVLYNDEYYPERLRAIPNPPILLFYKGERELLTEKYIVSIVGTRNPSEYSIKITEKISSSLVKNGIPVASGFAIGTDITAHMAAVRAGGKTLAVLGSGIGHRYPVNNMQYADEIEKNGVFISEYFPNTSAKPQNFLMRNRILSGMSMGVAVIEAAERSGSLNTASHAISQGKDIWVVPTHDITNERYYGNSNLLRDGAMPLTSVGDILGEHFRGNEAAYVRDGVIEGALIEREKVKIPASLAEKIEDNSKKELKEKIIESKPIPEGAAGIVYAAIRDSDGISPDEIAMNFGLDISEVLTIVTDLELEEKVFSETGQKYFLKE